jgi:hypothetical protein
LIDQAAQSDQHVEVEPVDFSEPVSRMRSISTVGREAKPIDPSGDNAAKISQAGDLLDFAVDKTTR